MVAVLGILVAAAAVVAAALALLPNVQLGRADVAAVVAAAAEAVLLKHRFMMLRFSEEEELAADPKQRQESLALLSLPMEVRVELVAWLVLQVATVNFMFPQWRL